MTKLEMANAIIKSVFYDGIKDTNWLCRTHTKGELIDMYNQMLEMETYGYWY